MPTLEWIGKEKVINHDKEVPFKLLDAQYTFDEKGKREGEADSGNKIIHGDNLLALKALLPKYQEKARESGLPEDAQAANDFANMIGRFEKKIHDLELTRTISIQMSPQIRMVQNNDTLMMEKIRSSINNTIPLWKNQMVLALSLFHSDQAMKAQREVTNVTNQLLEANAQALHQGSVEIAKESERGIVDMETLIKTNEELIKTLDEVRQIQDDGRTRRAAAEKELEKIEGELKQKLLEIKG